MKKCFITGLIVLFPAVITIFLVLFIADLITRPFVGFVQQYLLFALNDLSLFWLKVLSKLIALGLIVVSAVFIGLLARIYFLNVLGRWGEYLIENIPVINKIYQAARDVVKTVFSSTDEKEKFDRVVAVPYPNTDTLSLGLMPNDTLPEGSDKEHENLVPVFIPGCPNPTIGFMLMFEKEDVTYLEMSVEDALHMIISLGVVTNQDVRK